MCFPESLLFCPNGDICNLYFGIRITFLAVWPQSDVGTNNMTPEGQFCLDVEGHFRDIVT